ncbi:hypothetical protein [Methylobacterium oryzihabitans]|uniref:Uncharacterized protein n=1 Tax=Methylobacterium oryzihabitans TaxID=2499852 RepID=A0A3S2XG15_9HYPH|nr:hypothetical protein [Methylobacterium oryzihabitans]RVU13853.1 hypothetical protein EOE48_25760 [Methylobacterium oryzihabitans]
MSAASEWRETRNVAARVRLERALPAVFPAAVLAHALSRPLVPPTPRLAVESYWRHHLVRADRLARGLAARSGTPEGWTWRLGALREDGLPLSFRMPPAPFREPAFARERGHCRICGQPVYRFGWHADLWGAGVPNRNAGWHAACVAAWKLWTAPAEQVKALKARQRHRCAESGKRLLRTAEVDHRTPLYRVWREHREAPWPVLLGYWGVPNLQVVNRTIHAAKCAEEAGERAQRRRDLPPPG